MLTTLRSRTLIVVSLFIAACALTSAAFAAPAPPTGGQVQQTVPKPPPLTPTTPKAPLVQPATPAAATAAGGPKFRVDSFAFSGNTVVTTEQLQTQIADLVGRTLSMADLQLAAQTLSRYYHSRGYPLATVTLPAQKIEGNAVRFEVIEGRLGDIRVEGNSIYDTESILYSFSELPRGQPIVGKDLERELLQLNDQPGLDARAVVVPGKRVGESDLVVKVDEQRVDLRVTVDNHGRESTGDTRITFDGNVNSMMGWGDQLSFTLMHAERDLLLYRRLGYSLPIDETGARLGISYYETQYTVDDPAFSVLAIDGSNSGLRVGYIKPLARSRAHSSAFAVGVERLETETTSLGSPVASSAITLARIGMYSSGVTDGAQWTSGLTYSGNFRYNDGLETDSQLGKLQLDLTRFQSLAGAWGVIARLSGAYGFGPVVDMEKFSIGGPYSVRGYEPASARGDSGLDASVELQRRFGSSTGGGALAFFGDLGYVSSGESLAPTTGGLDGPWLGSVGLGLRLFGGQNFSASIDWAYPFGELEPTDGYTRRLWGTISVGF